MAKKRVLGVVGMGHVGAHVAYALAIQGIADELVLVDQNEQKLASEVQDLRDAVAYMPHRVTVRGGDFSDLGVCDVIVNSVGKIDLLRGTQLGRNIRNYTFFSYEVREALHLSEQERRTILDCLHNIRHELQHAIDRHSRTLVVNNIEMFLNYCVRFYDRQFITRSDVAGKDILARFERTLDDYFLSDKPQTEGLPTVQYCTQELHLSANYFGDLVKRLTGKTAQEHIRLRLIDAAKERIADPARSIAEVAYELGFKYPAHFTRLFKNVVGCTPNRYRSRFD